MLSWLSGGQSLQQLIAAKKWDKAVVQLQAEIKNAPKDSRTRMQLADVLIEAGRGKDAVPILLKLAQEFGTEGSAPRAIAVLKKIERIQPGRSDVQKALAALIKKSAPKQPVSSGIDTIVRGSDQFEMEEIGLDLRPSIEPSDFLFQAPAALPPPPPSTPDAVKSAPPPPKEEEEMVEMEDLVMPPPMTLLEIASTPPPPPPPATAATPQTPAPRAPQVVQMTEAATMIAAMNDTEKGLFDDLLDTIEAVLAEAPAAVSSRASTPKISSPLFADFSEADLVAVIQGLELATYGPGEILILEGDPGTSLFVITSGVVRAFVRQADGKNKQVREMGEGSFFGEIAVLSGKPRTATVTAKTAVEALVLERKTLDNIVQDASECEDHPPEIRGGTAEDGKIAVMVKVLLVEDNEMNRDMLSRRLAKRGYTVVMAIDGQQGIDMAVIGEARHHPPRHEPSRGGWMGGGHADQGESARPRRCPSSLSPRTPWPPIESARCPRAATTSTPSRWSCPVFSERWKTLLKAKGIAPPEKA